MRSEAVSWDDWSMGNPPPIADADKWHVQFAPDEVKVVSLEQLDDLFRLSIVDSETQVWQTGMIEWQPLRVIAGLDEQPAPLPKRAPPKPPTRTVVMAQQPAVHSVRPAAPAPRSVSPSVRPAPPAARPVSLAPASFYPEPIQAMPSAHHTQSAYAAPIAFAATAPAMNSVRPLVVSHAPPMAARGGGGFGRFLVGLALLAGVSITAYRNDLLREAAHEAHQDALYARLETELGGPAFGTVRALEQAAASLPTTALASNVEAPVRSAISEPAAAAPSTHAPAGGTTTPPVVSLESLAPEQKGQIAAEKSQAAAVPATVTAPPVRTAASFVQPKPVAAPAPAKAPPARPAVAAKPVVEKPAPVAQKPASEMTERERLNAAIGQSMTESAAPKAKGKKAKSKGNNEYDPLNPTL